MRNRKINRWIGLFLIAAMMITIWPPLAVDAATGARIEIVNLYKANRIVNDRPDPAEENRIIRYTTNPISLVAEINGIEASQIPNLYYEITSTQTGQTTDERSNKAQYDSATHEIVFNNVFLYEGLNKVTIKLAGSTVISSEPAWAIFTPTTSIENLRINGEPLNENRMYPTAATSTRSVVVTGDAPNATDVTAQLFGDTAKSLFMSNGQFMMTGDDRDSATNPDFKLFGGDNLFAFLATNASKTYTVQRNIIYDNGKPFAFDAKINGVIVDEQATASGTNYYFKHPDVVKNTVQVYPGPGKTGTRHTNFSVQRDATGKPFINWNSITGAVYISYETSGAKLVTTPTITTPQARIDAKLKNNVNSLNAPEYDYLDVFIDGQLYNKYYLGDAEPAPRVVSSFPSTFYKRYSTTDITLFGQALDSPGLRLYIEGMNGTKPLDTTTPNGYLVPNAGASGYEFVHFTIDEGILENINEDAYVFTLRTTAGTGIAEFVVPVEERASISVPTVEQVTINSLSEGYNAASRRQTVELELAPTASDLSRTRIEIYDIDGNNVGNGTNLTAIAATTSFTFDLPPALRTGDYKVRISYDNQPLSEHYFRIFPAEAPGPQLDPISEQRVLPYFDATITGIDHVPAHFVVHGRNFGTDLSLITNARLGNPIDPSNPGPPNLTPIALEDDYVIFQLTDGGYSTFLEGASDITFTLNAVPLNTAAVLSSNTSSAFLLTTPVLGGPNPAFGDATYASGQYVTGINLNSRTGGNQMTLEEAEASNTQFTLQGKNLSGTLNAQIADQFGVIDIRYTIPPITVNPNGLAATVTSTLR